MSARADRSCHGRESVSWLVSRIPGAVEASRSLRGFPQFQPRVHPPSTRPATPAMAIEIAAGKRDVRLRGRVRWRRNVQPVSVMFAGEASRRLRGFPQSLRRVHSLPRASRPEPSPPARANEFAAGKRDVRLRGRAPAARGLPCTPAAYVVESPAHLRGFPRCCGARARIRGDLRVPAGHKESDGRFLGRAPGVAVANGSARRSLGMTDQVARQDSSSASSPFTRSPVHPFTRSPVHPFTRSPVHPITPSLHHSITPSPLHPYTPTPRHPNTPPPQHPASPAARDWRLPGRRISGRTPQTGRRWLPRHSW